MMFGRARFLVFVAAAVTMACGGGTSGPEHAPAPDLGPTASVAGHVRLTGPPPAADIVRIDGDRNCVTAAGADRLPAEFILAGPDGALQNVFVYVKAGLEKHTFPVPAVPVVIDQQKCRYLPRVVGVRVGQPLEIRNSDPLLHNVRATAAINQPFNQGQPVQGMKYSHTFTTREVMVPLGCDVHAWMNAYVGALEHPYFTVTGESGTFRLDDLPAGTYTIEAWHERLGTASQLVTLGAKDLTDVVFTFSR